MPARSPNTPAARARIRTACLTAFCLSLAAAGTAFAQGPRAFGINLNSPTLTGQHLAVADKSGLQGHADYTLEAWVRPDSWTGYPCIVGNNFTQSFWLGLNTSGHVRFYPRGGLGQYVESVATIPLGTWTHVAATYRSASGWALYVNGALDASGAGITGAPGTSADSLCIGADLVGGAPGTFWRGKLDRICLWNRALTGAEIRDHRFTGVGVFGHQGTLYAGLKGCWSRYAASGTPPRFTDQTWTVGPLFAPAEVNDAFVNGDFSIVTGSGSTLTPVPLDHNVALELNGIDDYASVVPHADGYAGGLTIEAWIHPYSYTNYPTIVGRDYQTSFWFGLRTDGHLRFYPAGASAVDGNAVIPLNRWTHVAATYDPAGGTTRLFINGEQDLQSTVITGPIGENGRHLFVGADNEAGGPWYYFKGMLDEVCITNGPLSPLQVRERRFFGDEPQTDSFGNEVIDLYGVTRRTYRAHFGPYTYWMNFVLKTQPDVLVFGSHSRLVLSGAPMFGAFSGTTFAVDEFTLAPPGGQGLSAPDLLTLTSLSIPIEVNGPSYVTDADVFLSLSSEDLSQTTCTVRSPSGTDVTLLPPGVLEGRSLQTVFNDESPSLFSTWGAPCETYDVQPASPLHAVDLERADGIWTVTVQTAGGARFAVWAAGIRVARATVDVGDGAPPAGVVLANAGAEPVRGSGAVRFSLPRESRLRLSLYDVAGREVRTLQRGTRAAGEYHIAWSAAGLSPGRYVIALDLEDGTRRTLPVTVLR